MPSAFCLAKGHAFRETKHGDPTRGPQRLADRPAGSCIQCHDAQTPLRRSDNEVCFTCHATRAGDWMQSSHATSTRGGDKCVDCHDPHGVKDPAGVVSAMLVQREPELCFRCHQEMRAFRHGTALNRRAACSDCHNVHRAAKDRIPAEAPAASAMLVGVARVEVANGPAGTAPRYTPRDADDPTPASEYEICFRCHSSYQKLRPGQPDLALLTNPTNASFHPIQAAGKNNIDPRAFAGTMSATSLITCSDCHDALHGQTSAMRGDACFACHNVDISRFSAHALHAQQQIVCGACHDPHGSARHAALIVTGRVPGIISYTQNANGGTCTSMCHGTKTYGVGYAR